MKIILSENGLKRLALTEALNEYNISDGSAEHNPYKKKLDQGKRLLQNLVSNYGKVMYSLENGKDYFVYELYALSELLGVRYAICRPIKDGEATGTVMMKPLATFRVKNY